MYFPECVSDSTTEDSSGSAPDSPMQLNMDGIVDEAYFAWILISLSESVPPLVYGREKSGYGTSADTEEWVPMRKKGPNRILKDIRLPYACKIHKRKSHISLEAYIL